ncbi:MAG: hypothetical protein ABWY12_17545 [Burkholderiales bacterium]
MNGAVRQKRYEQVATFCHHFFAQTGFVPSYTTIATALGICDRQTVRQHVVEAERRGLLHRAGQTVGGSGRTQGQRIRLGRADEAQVVTIKMGRDL